MMLIYSDSSLQCFDTVGWGNRKAIWPVKSLLQLLVHGQVTIIFVVSVCQLVCLFVQSFFSRLRSDLDQTRTHVTCPGL